MNLPLIGVSGRVWTELGLLPVLGTRMPYLDAIQVAGGIPFIFPLPKFTQDIRVLYESCSGVLLTGGEDVDPKHYNEQHSPKLGVVAEDRDRIELTLARWALEEHKPILGICRGIQVLNVAAQGSLHQDISTELPTATKHQPSAGPVDDKWFQMTHRLQITPDSLLARAIGVTDIETNSLHHQCIKEVAPAFTVTARSDDGIIEAIEHRNERFALGVQNHPETLWQQPNSPWAGLFREFVQAAREYASTVPLHYVPLVPYSDENFQKR